MSEQIVTPAFVINEAELARNMEALEKALRQYWQGYIIGYSYKTNSLPWLLQYMRQRGWWAEVVSGTEYRLAEAIGYRDQIIYNGPVKEKNAFFQALCGNNIINLDSKRELIWLQEYGAANIHAKIGLRVNFDLEQECPGETVAAEAGSRFGFCLENGELEEAICLLNRLDIPVQGLHMHISTKTRSQKIYKTLSQKAVEIAKRYQLRLSYVDIGGGFFAGGSKIDAYAAYCKTISEELGSYFKAEELTLIVEPGASVIASPVLYANTVVDVKDTDKARFVVTDGSRLHIDPFLAKQRYDFRLENTLPNTISEQVICGYTCMEKDRFMKLEDAEELQVGSRVYYECTGSYTMCLNALFIDYLPNVYVNKPDGLYLVREKWGVNEYLQQSKMQ